MKETTRKLFETYYNAKMVYERAYARDLIGYTRLDEDGYPTSDVLHAIRIWPNDDPAGWFEVIESIWHHHSFSWCSDDAVDVYGDVHEYKISTCGWSGNESVIEAMKENVALWWQCWVSNKRGGHYVFHVRTDRGCKHETF